MLHSKYKWNSPEADPALTRELARSLSVSSVVASLLVNRGIRTAEEAHAFINGSAEHSHDPYLLRGMTEAVARIRSALDGGEHILIYGDYDADGVSSTSLMMLLLRHCKASFDIYIPHRQNEGYGLHNHAIDWALQQGVTLIVTVDTGISAVEQIAYANELGIDVVVTDHHEPPPVLPDAHALVNPKLPDCPYPFKGLAGVGVAFKLAEALLSGDVPEAWTQIAAIGTIADLMPLTGENREIVRRGLSSMRHSAFPGVRALLEVSGVNVQTVNSINIAFGLAPRINASGRLDHAGRAVALLTAESVDEAAALADELDMLNKERQLVVERIVSEASARLEQLSDEELPPVLVLAGEGWNVGVVGIVASKLLERYYRPVVILDIHPETGMCKGSARSIPGFDIYAALSSCSHLMDHFGGHPAAAGMSLHRDSLDAFSEALSAFAGAVLKPEHFEPVTEADGEYALEQLTLEAADELEKLSPYGMANPSPRFIVRGALVREVRTMGRDNRHLKLVLQQGRSTMETVAFGKGELAGLLPAGTRVDILAELSVNEWNGQRKPQLMLQDLAVPETQLFDLRNAPDAVRQAERIAGLLRACAGPAPMRAAAVCKPERRPGTTELKGMTLWVYDKEAGIVPADASSAEEARERIHLLCLLDMPETPEQLDAVLSAFSNAENVALLHSARDSRERLQTPTREHFKHLYKQLAAAAAEPVPERDTVLRFSRVLGVSPRMVGMMLDVFEELEFIGRERGQVRFLPQPAAKSLTASRNFVRLGELAEMEQLFIEASPAQLWEWLQSRSLGAS